VEADPAYYRSDSASAFDAARGNQVTLELRRVPHRSRALRATRGGEIRYSAINFTLDLHMVQLDVCPLDTSTRVLRPDPAPEARLVLLGSSPVNWPAQAMAGLRQQLREPIGILPTASGEAAAMAERYLHWLSSSGVAAEVLPVTLNNIERAGRDRSLLRSIDRMGSLLLTGGDQRRLIETLLHCAEATPVLHALVSAYERGVPLLAVGGAAAALGSRMITDGDSVAALRYGSSEDASAYCVVVERGIGLTDLGLVDQNFLRRRRLGRLLIACAEQRHRFGFGLCEGSGMVIRGDERRVEAFGSHGVVIAELDLDRVRLSAQQFDPAGIRLYLLEPGQSTSLDGLAAATAARSAEGQALLERAVYDLEHAYRSATESSLETSWSRQLIEPRSALH
jgi:cyanophycinase